MMFPFHFGQPEHTISLLGRGLNLDLSTHPEL